MNETTPENYQPSPEPVQEQPVAEIAPAEMSPEDAAVFEMLQLAIKEGLDKAIAKVKGMGDPSLEDKFHDVIMNNPELRAQLEASGKLEKL